MIRTILRLLGLIKDSNKGSVYARSLHGRNISASESRLDTLLKIGLEKGLPAQLNYLRKVNPLVFEEMILTAIERKNHKVTRNKRYTGDQGIDGSFEMNGQLYYIQAKRYANLINPRHVKDFYSLCERLGARGIFVHTGRTGNESYNSTGNRVEIISGNKLIRLLLPTQHFNANS